MPLIARQDKNTSTTDRPPVIRADKQEEIIIRCSSLDRIAECPGSANAERNLENHENPAAASGTRCHLALQHILNKASLNDYNLLLESVDVQKQLLDPDDPRESFIVSWFADELFHVGQNHGGVKNVWKEFPVSIQVNDFITVPGHPDIMIECEDGTFHLFDYKTGRLAVDTSDTNIQLQAYAVAVVIEKKLNSLTCHILSAGNEDDQSHTKTTYQHRHIEAIYANILDICTRSADKHASRIAASSQCKYCTAQGTQGCPENEIFVRRAREKLEALITDEDAVFGDLPDKAINELIDGAMACKSYSEKVLKVAKSFLKENDERDLAFIIGKGRKVRKFSNPKLAAERMLKNKQATKDDIGNLMNISVAEVDKFLYEKEKARADEEGNRPKRKLDVLHEFHDDMEDLISVTEQSGSLQRKK